MNRSAEAKPAALGLTIAFPLRMPAGGVVSTQDVEQLQQGSDALALGQQAA